MTTGRIERTDAHGFVADFNRAYERKTELSGLCGHRFYGGPPEEEEEGDGAERDRKRNYYGEDPELSYHQIGRRTAVPLSLVEEGRYGYISDAVVGALCEGEKSFLARSLSDSADEGGLPTVTVAGVGGAASRAVEEAIDSVDDPDHLLLPRTGTYEDLVDDWEAQGRVRRFGENRYLRSGGPESDGDDRGEDGEGGDDCWIHTYDTDGQRPGEFDAFVINDERVTVVQKKGEDVRPPAFGHVEEYDELNDDLPLTVYFGDETRDGGDGKKEFFDVVYRVVVSEPVVEEGGACRLRLAETP